MGRNDVNWAKIKSEYITGDLSIRKIAEKYNVSPSVVGRHSKRENWSDARKKHRDKVHTKSIQKIADKQADQLARIMSIAERVGDQIEQLLNEELKDPELILNTRMHNRELESKVNALTKLYELQARHLGIMAPRDAEKLRLERERFEYEKARAEKDANDDKTVEVVFSAETEEFSE